METALLWRMSNVWVSIEISTGLQVIKKANIVSLIICNGISKELKKLFVIITWQDFYDMLFYYEIDFYLPTMCLVVNMYRISFSDFPAIRIKCGYMNVRNISCISGYDILSKREKLFF